MPDLLGLEGDEGRVHYRTRRRDAMERGRGGDEGDEGEWEG